MNKDNQYVDSGKHQKNDTKRIGKTKFFVYFIIFELLFSFATAPLIVYYGPFNNLKKMVVGAAMSSYSHQYIATLFLSQSQIDKIRYGETAANSTSPSNITDSAQEDLSQIKTSINDSSIELKKVQGGAKFSGLMMIIHNPTKVKVGYSKLLGEQGEKTSTIAKEFSAIAAINGGGFTDQAQNTKAKWTGTGALPEGIVISHGKVVYPTSNIDYNKKIDGDVVGITNKGVLIVGKYSINYLLKNQVTDALTFGPVLILNGIAQKKDSSGKNIDSQGPAPRTVIGQRKEDGAILLLVIDGRQGLQAGATIKELQNIMMQEGAYNAINLDGGASTTMYYNGKILNNPSDKFGERPIPTIFYVNK